MIITSLSEGIINGTTLKVGTKNYPNIDHTDPKTAAQLRTLRDDVKTILFSEILEGDRVQELKRFIKDKKNPFKEEDVLTFAKDATRLHAPGVRVNKPEKVVIPRFKIKGEDEKEKDGAIDWDSMTNADAIPIINAIRQAEEAKEEKASDAGTTGTKTGTTKRDGTKGSSKG